MTQLTKAKSLPFDDILRGIRAGRSLKQIEEALGVSAVDFLEAVEHDEGLNLRYKQSLSISAYSLSAEMMEKLRLNYENPESAVKNNALKLYMDHVHKEIDARNPAVFSGKAPINVSVPIQITTSLDMGGQKTLEGVYELKAAHEAVVEKDKLHIDNVISAGDDAGRAEPLQIPDKTALQQPEQNPFEALFAEKVSADAGSTEKEAQESRESAEQNTFVENVRPSGSSRQTQRSSAEMGKGKSKKSGRQNSKVAGRKHREGQSTMESQLGTAQVAGATE